MSAASDGRTRTLHAGDGRARALSMFSQRLSAHDVADGAVAARVLFTGLLGLSLAQIAIAPTEPLTEEDVRRLEEAARRYCAGETPGRILGEREFWGLRFRLAPDTLEPRPDTETVVETVLRRLTSARQADPLRIVDFGVGSGCILVALLSELPQAWGVGVDLSPGAATQAAANAHLNGAGDRASFVVGDWATALSPEDGDGFDVVTSNPPYIERFTLPGLPAAVRRNDPMLALDGGHDGLGPYRILVPEALRLLHPGGLAALEVGAGQAATVAALMRSAGFEAVEVTEDLGGVMRVVSGVSPGGAAGRSEILLGVAGGRG